MSVTPIVVVGAGGFGREVVDLVRDISADGGATSYGGPFELLGVVDDGIPDLSLLERVDAPFLGPVSALAELSARGVRHVVAVGDPATRRRLAKRLDLSGEVVLVHPTATVGSNVTLGLGTILCAQSAVTTNVRFGRSVHVNLGCTVGHDVRLDDFVTLSPRVSVSGGAHVEEDVFLGTGAVLNPSVRVGCGAVVGSGAVVTKDVARGTLAVGVPARAHPSRG